ncbi:uncharacterized protein PV07_09977 [Cladophialophora immunda]|uniref:Uncharacterized protein n=1 Tax=Cladophialophora immunda TaxID=569365 RepID=A0A0D2CL13_9EURO|nr:uncharacterized protein PV07_09977 [Cladophialophora immunda]KIW24249.1 hypothetical protein PV07_09977 [Cladophialophora immunda]OQV09583.1 hypothetical protein CLAIMM_13690 [Cladophialophora immunda]
MSLQKVSDGFDRFLYRLSHSKFIRDPRVLHYVCTACGTLSGLTFFAGFLAASFLPPLPPYWSAERTQEHYMHHWNGIHAASALFMFSGMFFIPYVGEISHQMRRIPNIPWILPMIQLGAGAYSVIGFQLPGMALAAAALRKDRNPEILQFANDQFWLFAIMPFQSFWPWSWSWAYAILLDDREKPLYPKYMALFNFFAPLSFLFGVAIHVTTTGPFAWNGGLAFWIPLVLFGLQYSGDTFYLFRAIYNNYFETADEEQALPSDHNGPAKIE